MIGRLLSNDIRNHKLMSVTTVLFMAASAMLLALTAVLFTGLLGSVDSLMSKAKTPDYLQMHTGAVEAEKIAAFIRDSQMNSMLASSKRFLVDQRDYDKLKEQGEEEYLIEFLLREGADADTFAAKYGEAELYANGPAITKPLIKMMNALSDGIMILLFIRHRLKKMEQMTALEALFAVKVQGKKAEAGKYVMIGSVTAACAFLALIPQYLSSTLSSPTFVTYRGIGDAQLRMDVRMSEHIEETTDQLAMRLEEDPDVTDYVALKTVSYPACPADGSQVNLLVEIGDHSVFPVSYAKGSYPKEQDEIALSSLLAQELGVKIRF